MQKALSYIESSAELSLSVDDIREIWVSSDDEAVASEVKQSFPDLFPYVGPQRVIGNSDRTSMNMKTPSGNLPTTSNDMVRTMIGHRND